MERKFNTKIIEIKTIGDELRFQREYYNFKNSPKKYTRKTNSGEKSQFVGDKLKEHLLNNFETYKQKDKWNSRDNLGEYGTNESVIYAIEEGHYRRTENVTFYPERHYLRMYSLFKIYKFLDDFEILTVLKKYNITPDFEKSIKEKEKIKKDIINCFYKEPQKQLYKLLYTRTTNNVEKLFNENEIKNVCNNKKLIKKLLSINNYRNLPANFNWLLKEKFKCLSNIDKKCLSLDLGKETAFVDNILQENIEYLSFETIFKIIKYLNIEDTDFYNWIQEMYKNHRINEINLDILKINEL